MWPFKKRKLTPGAAAIVRLIQNDPGGWTTNDYNLRHATTKTNLWVANSHYGLTVLKWDSDTDSAGPKPCETDQRAIWRAYVEWKLTCYLMQQASYKTFWIAMSCEIAKRINETMGWNENENQLSPSTDNRSKNEDAEQSQAEQNDEPDEHPNDVYTLDEFYAAVKECAFTDHDGSAYLTDYKNDRAQISCSEFLHLGPKHPMIAWASRVYWFNK